MARKGSVSREQLEQDLQDPKVRAFLRTICKCEGTLKPEGKNWQDSADYKKKFGGSHFNSYAAHPRSAVRAGRYNSTAAGAYQFLERTWDGLARAFGFSDFSPHHQDLAAVALIHRRGAMPALKSGNVAKATQMCRNEWASLPGSPYGQPTKSLTSVLNCFQDALGKVFDGIWGPPAPAHIARATPKASIPAVSTKVAAAPVPKKSKTPSVT